MARVSRSLFMDIVTILIILQVVLVPFIALAIYGEWNLDTFMFGLFVAAVASLMITLFANSVYLMLNVN